MLFRFVIIITLCFCLTFKVSAQQAFTIKGVISKKLSPERVAQALITNLTTKTVMMSDEIGWFTIKASVGDTLLFSKVDFTDQRIIITSPGDLPVYMQPIIHLAEVKVQGQTKREELSDVMNAYRSKGIYYDGKPPITAFIPLGGSPLTGLYELFGKEPRQLRRFAAFSKNEYEYAEIKKRYNISVVKRVTHASDSTAKKFMEYYMPSYEDIKSWSDYDLIKQIRESYEFYNKSKDKQGLQNLNSPFLIRKD
jgi:hypothetical protein